MNLTVNGELLACEPARPLESLLAERGWLRPGVVVEHNGRVLRREDWAGVRLRDGDRLEVVTFVGGG